MIIQILLFICASHAVHGLEHCLQCSAVTDISTCQTVTCGANEVCFVERFVNGHAENLYTLGCRSKTAIACLVTPHSVGRRSGGQCGACCTGRNCQQKLCGLSGNDTTLSCRYCNYLVPGLSSCPTHTTCDPTEACKTAIHIIGGVIRYEYGCEQKHLCAAFLSLDQRNFNNEGVTICSACCVTNNCNENDDCYTLHLRTHWTFTLSSMLRTGETTYHGSPTFLDFNEMEMLTNMPSPRIFATHMTFDRLPKQAREGKGKILAVFRNPKDVVVSLHTFIKKLDHSDIIASWDGLIKFFLTGKMVYGSWFDHIKAWEKTKKEYKGDNIMYLIYEEMKQDLRSHVEKMASFLGADTGKEFLDQVTEKCTFGNMAAEATKTFKPSDQWKEVTSTKTLPIYRKGQIGDWMNQFTVAQNEYFDKVYEEKMKDSSFTFQFK